MGDYPRLVRLCQRYLWQAAGSRANLQDAEDIAHTAVLQTAAVVGDQDLHALFARIARCRAIDFARSLRPVVSLDAPQAPGADGVDRDRHGMLADLWCEGDFLAVEDRIASADLAHRIRASRVLTPLQLATAETVAACDGDLDEAATRLGVKYSAVTTRMHAARQTLAVRLPRATDAL
jgi:DNA-directed RNA polymerase specialized sigma24 family protein